MPDQPSTKPAQGKKQPRVALYVTCLVDSLRPEIGFACVKLIESLGFAVEVPSGQTCCGQPGYNGGHWPQARQVAKVQIQALEGFEYIVVPSGSCAGMIINHYPKLFADDPIWLPRAERVATRTRELCQFLVEQQWQTKVSKQVNQQHPPTHQMTWAYHTSCSCRRETRSHLMGAQLLTEVGVKLGPIKDQEVCCGFGGTFAAKYDVLSRRMGQNKLHAAKECGANGVTAADLGCLLQLQSLDEHAFEFRHIAEVLADQVGSEEHTHTGSKEESR